MDTRLRLTEVPGVSFTVDPDGLDGLRGELSAIESGMRSSGAVAGSCDPLDLGPNGDIWQALQDFHNNWSNGLALITHNIDRLAGLLGKAADDYRGTDDQLARQADPRSGVA